MPVYDLNNYQNVIYAQIDKILDITNRYLQARQDAMGLITDINDGIGNMKKYLGDRYPDMKENADVLIGSLKDATKEDDDLSEILGLMHSLLFDIMATIESNSKRKK